MVNFFFSILPLKIWQDFLLRKHIQNCPACQENLASLEETKSVLIQEGEVEGHEGLWPKVKVQLTKEKGKERLSRQPHWGWAVGTACALIVALLSIWFYQLIPPGKAPEQDITSPFQIKYIRIYDEPARTYLFQPQDSNMIIVWAEKDI
jgi:hypothetical protein